jgi:hypothetical protein
MALACPKCRKGFIQRTRIEGTAARLLSLLSRYPFRCQVCGHQFSAYQAGGSASDFKEERRKYLRFMTRFPATFMLDRLRGKGEVTEISVGGCAMETDATLSPGSILRLMLMPPASDAAIAVDAALIRSVRGKKVGIEFLRFQPEEKERLNKFVVQFLVSRQS